MIDTCIDQYTCIDLPSDLFPFLSQSRKYYGRVGGGIVLWSEVFFVISAITADVDILYFIEGICVL